MSPDAPPCPTDEELAQSHLSGNADAFGAIVERYGPSLYGYARRLTGNDADAEDIAQETFVRLYDHLPKLDLERPLKPWLFHVCTNLCRNLAKKKKAIPFSAFENEDGDSALESLEQEASDQAEILDTDRNRERVRAAIRKLPSKYQTVIALYYWEDLSYEEIADILGLPINTVRTHLRRAKEQIATFLSKTS